MNQQSASPTIPFVSPAQTSQQQWLETLTVSGENAGSANARIARVSLVVQHDRGRQITGYKIDMDRNGIDNTAAAPTVALPGGAIQQPVVQGGHIYTRISFDVAITPGAITTSCPTFGGRSTTARVANQPIRIAAVDNAPTPQVSAASTSNINFTSATQCGSLTGNNEDYPLITQIPTQSQTEINTGQNVNFSFVCDDPDGNVLTSNSACNGFRWRARRMTDNAQTTPASVCQPGDNTTKTLNGVNFPNRGRWVIEAELLNNSGTDLLGNPTDCNSNHNPNYWWRIGTVDVNSPQAASPELSLSPTRPVTGGSTTVTATFNDTDDQPQGGRPADLEWDVDENTGNGVGGFEIADLAELGNWFNGLGSPRNRSIPTGALTPGIHTVRARVSDNGALSSADNIRSSTVATAQYLVNTNPTGQAQSLSLETHETLPITLAGTDPDVDPNAPFTVDQNNLGFTITDAPDNGSLSGSGANRTYDPAPGFAGTDSFSYQVADGFGGTDTETITIRVDPDTNLEGAPAGTQATRAATVDFSTTVTAPPTLAAPTFECQLDDGPFQPCSPPFTYMDLSDGHHDVTIRTKAVGNTDPTPVVTGFEVDAFPVLTITDQPDADTNETDATVEFTAAEPGATADPTTECSIDGGDRNPCESGQTYTDLPTGDHSITVYATDAFGKEVSETVNWTIDADGPTTNIDDGPDPFVNTDEVEVGFSSNDPGSTFECSLDGAAFATCTSPVTLSGLTEGAHTFEVRSIDSSNNTDPTPASITFRVDLTAPETTVGPEPTEPVRGDVTFGISSDDPAATFECSLDGGAYAACTSPYTSPSGLPDGPHSVDVRAIDAAGNIDPSPATFEWVRDATAPSVSIDSGPAAGSTITTSSATFGFSSSNGGSTFLCSVDGEVFRPCDSSSSENIGGLDDGAHSFAVKTQDVAGNESATVTRNFSVDSTPPETAIDSGPTGTISSTSATFAISSPDGSATFECRLDGGAYSACTNPKSYTGLANGAHTVEVRAKDAAGNLDPTPASRTFTVNSTTLPPGNQPPVTPPAPTCNSFGVDIATCGVPSMTASLKGSKRGGVDVALNGDSGGAPLSSVSFKLPGQIKLRVRGKAVGSSLGSVTVLGSSGIQTVPLTVASRGSRLSFLPSGGIVVVLDGASGPTLSVTGLPAGATQVTASLTARTNRVLSTKKRCKTLTFTGSFTDRSSKSATASAAADTTCRKKKKK